MAAPVVWVATELGRTLHLTGFPWVLLGYSQVTVLPIAQLASLVGVYGVSMLRRGRERGAGVCGCTVRDEGRVRYLPVAGALIIVLAIAGWGSRRVGRSEWTRAGEPIRVGLIQGNVDQAQKWDAERASAIFQDYLQMTRQAHARRRAARAVARVVDAVPLRRGSPGGSRGPDACAAGTRADPLRQRPDRARPAADRFYNSAFLVRADGTTGGVYRKMHLVPFGEYVPLQRLLFFAAPLVEQAGTFRPGLDPELLPVDGHRVSIAICYEVVYPDLVRQFVAGGSELLTTITNDAWFGQTSAPYQHFAAGVDAGDRERTVPGAIRQHRHQRHRRSVRPRARADADLRAAPSSSARRASSRRRPSSRRHGDVARVRVRRRDRWCCLVVASRRVK